MERYFILLGVVIAPVAMLLAMVLAWRALADRDRRRSPLNFKLLNLPGEGLRAKIAEHEEAMAEAGAVAVIAGPITLAAWAVERLHRVPGGLTPSAGDWLFVVLLVAMIGWSARKFILHGRQRRKYRQGLEAERATAQNLLPLLAEGCIVFHDFPADGFNIDHIVVAPHAVYAIESKSRRKPSAGGAAAARVRYDGRGLVFPTHAETKPITQAKTQAEWLRRFLTSATGEPTSVTPVLALPGWFIELDREGSRAAVIVNNLRNPQFLMRRPVSFRDDRARQQRIVHALTERYPRTEG